MNLGDTPTVKTSPQTPPSKQLLASVVKFLEARVLLFRIETKEATLQFTTLLPWLILTTLAALTAWLLLEAALVGALSTSLGWSWVRSTAFSGVAHLLFALIAALITWRRLSASHWFPDSLNELKKDGLWLNTRTIKN